MDPQQLSSAEGLSCTLSTPTRSLPAPQRSLAPAPPPTSLRFVSCGYAELLMPTLGASPHRRTAASFACYAFHTGPLHAVPIPHAQTIP
ncbi:hypothetical protein B0H14DRAFT_3459736 [Mycena olivaceomarginata]|nr:hypothetical protein B0H14DRAFT_3459736 [Mycena olivaceomarginata]